MADVRLYFPNTNLELWTTQALLVNSSPHFATLFASGFAETVAARPKRRRIDAASPTATAEMDDEILLNDSDDEADGIYLKGKSATVDAGDTEYREIKITSAAYSTYKAVLTYLCTSHITFAPLLRSCRPDDEASRLELLERFHSSHSSHPIPVSPKSVYRLAHYLELPHLQALAFQAFKSQLTSEFLAHELVSSTVERYEELKEVVLAAAATEWEQVRQGAAMEEVTEAMAEDEKMAARYGRMLGDLIRRKEL